MRQGADPVPDGLRQLVSVDLGAGLGFDRRVQPPQLLLQDMPRERSGL